MEKKEAMKILKEFHDKSALFSVRTALDTIIPELKESEDEKMVKFIKNQLFNIKKTITENYELDAKLTKAIDWLEKQGEQNKQHLYDIIIALWDLLDKIDTFSDLQIDDTNPDNPFRKIEDITQERHKFVKSDGYDLFIEDFMITNDKNSENQGKHKETLCDKRDFKLSKKGL